MGPRKQAKDLRKGSSWELLFSTTFIYTYIYIYLYIYIYYISVILGAPRLQIASGALFIPQLHRDADARDGSDRSNQRRVLQQLLGKSLRRWRENLGPGGGFKYKHQGSRVLHLVCPTHGYKWFQKKNMFIPKIGEMIQFDKHIFQMGWFNHQLEVYIPENYGEGMVWNIVFI